MAEIEICQFELLEGRLCDTAKAYCKQFEQTGVPQVHEIRIKVFADGQVTVERTEKKMPPPKKPSKAMPAQRLDADLTRAEVGEALAQLSFSTNGHCTLQLDEGVRDFILNAIKERRSR